MKNNEFEEEYTFIDPEVPGYIVGQTVAQFLFAAQNENFTINDIKYISRELRRMYIEKNNG